MDTTRIENLLAPFLETSLSETQLEQISTYIDLLLRWNARINLTAIRTPEEIVTRHFGESLFLARHLFPHPLVNSPAAPAEKTIVNDAVRVADIGSGAGFPALPLKIWAPQINLTMIESSHKKAAFLSEVARQLTLTNINVIAERVETVAARSEASKTATKVTEAKVEARFEIVTFRAVEHFETILEQAMRLLAPKGRLALLIGESQLPLLTQTTLAWSEPIKTPGSRSRLVVVGKIPF